MICIKSWEKSYDTIYNVVQGVIADDIASCKQWQWRRFVLGYEDGSDMSKLVTYLQRSSK